MMHDRTCPACDGPQDILHTTAECLQAQSAGDDTVDRYYLSVIAQIISRSPGPLAAAHRLHADGFLKPPGATAC